MESLNRLGLPVKYAILTAVGLTLGRLLSSLLGLGTLPDLLGYVLGAVVGAAAGYVVGRYRQRRGKTC